MIPSEISLPLKTPMSSRMKRSAMTALNPDERQRRRTANVSGLACAIVLDFIVLPPELEFSRC